ncbi:MAG: WHG domain-containing protein [Actinomycetes bacterium]
MPRAGLTTDRVVREAEDLADEVGLPKLTLAEVAKRLGVRLPSLYKHVAGMDALQREIAIRAKLELAEVFGRAAVGRSGTTALRSMASAYRAWAIEHPGRYAATVRAPRADDEADQAASSAATSVVLDVIAGFDLRGVDAIDAARAIRSALHGFITLESEGGFGLPVDVDRSYAKLVEALCRSLETWASAPTSTQPTTTPSTPVRDST